MTANRVVLTGISSRSWEHPADRAALNSLRALPYFDDVVKKVVSYFGERGVRQIFLANAVRVGGRQRPDLDALYAEVLATMDAPKRWDLYVSYSPLLNAMAIGFEKPFIVLNSAMYEKLDREELRHVLAHEVGHVMSGHATYTTLAVLLVMLGINNLPFLAGLAVLPIELALLEWQRKAEFSADRAGLLGSQQPMHTMSAFLKFAGGDGDGDTIDLDTFLAQAAEYETEGDMVDKVWKLLNTAFRTHPFGTVRAAELQRWIASGDYDRVLRGEYPRRGTDEETRPLREDYADARQYYEEQARSAVDGIRDSLGRARDAFNQSFRGPRRKP